MRPEQSISAPADRRDVADAQFKKQHQVVNTRFKKALLLFLGFAISVALAECLTRIVSPRPVPQFLPSQNFRLIYELNPKYPEINSMGMRDEEIDLATLHKDFVIAAIGDSHTYSPRSKKREDTFPTRLQYHLRLSGKKVRVLNFGVPGYNMVQELEVLRTKALGFKPDSIILQYTINDDHISNYIQPQNAWLNSALHHSVFLTNFWTSFLYSRFGRRYAAPYVEEYAPDLLLFSPGLVGTAKSRETDPAHAPHPPRSKDQVPVRYHGLIGRDNLERAVRVFGQICKNEKIPLIATGFIESHDEGLYLESGFRVHSFYQIFDGIRMQDYGYNPARTSGHFNESGSDFIGKALANFIVESQFADGR